MVTRARWPFILAAAATLASLGLLTWPGAASARGVGGRNPGGLVVVNGEGRVVGPALVPTGIFPAYVAVVGPDGVVLVQVTADGFRGTTNPVFESADCSGPPLILARSGGADPVVPATALTLEGLVVSRGSPTQRIVNSRLDLDTLTCGPLVFPADTLETSPLALDIPVPPFSLLATLGPGVGRQPGRAVVVDDAGRVVGPLSYWSAERGFPLAVVSDSPPLLVGVFQDGFQSPHSLSFESDDCSGTPLIEAPGDTLVPRTAIGPDNVVFATAGSPPAEEILLGSRWSPTATPPACEPVVFLQLSVAVSPAAVGPFTPPFHVRLEDAGSAAAARGRVGPLILRDATGQPIGLLADSDSGLSDLVLLQAGDRLAPARAARGFLTGLSQLGTLSAFFEEAACAGAALLPEGDSPPGAALLPTTVVDRDVLRVGVGPAGPRTVVSRWDAEAGGCENFDSVDGEFHDTEAFASLEDIAFPLEAW